MLTARGKIAVSPKIPLVPIMGTNEPAQPGDEPWSLTSTVWQSLALSQLIVEECTRYSMPAHGHMADIQHPDMTAMQHEDMMRIPVPAAQPDRSTPEK